jgi:hypothetical protein
MADADTMVGPLGWWTFNRVPRNRLLLGLPSGKPHIQGYRLGLRCSLFDAFIHEH